MTTLNEELLIRIAADVSDLKAGMAQAKDQVKSVGDAGTAAGKKVDAANKTMLQSAQAVRRSYMSIVGLFTLVGTAIAAVTRPILAADDAIGDLQGSLLLANKSFAGTANAVHLSADALGITYTEAADRAAVAVRRYGQSSAGALASVRVGSKLAALGFGTLEQAQQAALQVAEAFGLDMYTAGTTIQNTLGKGAVLAKADLLELSGALVQLAPQAQALHVDMGALVATIGAMRQNGAPLSDVVSALSEAMGAALKPTQDQATALTNLGIGAVSFAGTGIVGVMERLGQAAAIGDERFRAIADSNSALATSLVGVNQQVPQFSGALKEMAAAGKEVASALEKSDSTFDSLAKTLPQIANALSTLVAPINAVKDAWNAVTAAAKEAFSYDVAPNVRVTGRRGYAAGGTVGGTGNTDTVPAMLTPGEFVIKKKVADQMRPFLNQLNAGNTDLMSLWNTALSNTLVKGTHLKLLDALGIQHPQRGLAGTSFNAAYGASGERVSGLASSILNKFQSIQLSRGGSVPTQRLAAGGSVASAGPRIQRSTTIEGGVTINVQGRSFSSSWVRRQLAPELERIADRKQSRRKRTGR